MSSKDFPKGLDKFREQHVGPPVPYSALQDEDDSGPIPGPSRQRPPAKETPENPPPTSTLPKYGLCKDGKWYCNCKPRALAKYFAVHKSGPNKGRCFYSCPNKDNGCDFFLWAEEAGERAVAEGTARTGLEPVPDIPALLSPLRPSFEGDSKTPRSTKAMGSQHQKSPRKIPALLSPTFPPISELEQDLARKESLRPRTNNAEEDNPDSAKPSFWVTLKYPKRLSSSVRRILVVPPTLPARESVSGEQKDIQVTRVVTGENEDIHVRIEGHLDLDLPRGLQVAFSRVVQEHADGLGRELKPDEVTDLFEKTYFLQQNQNLYFKLDKCSIAPDLSQSKTQATRDSMWVFEGVVSVDDEEIELCGRGNGPISSLTAALKDIGVDLEVQDYKEHVIGEGRDVQTATYIECKEANSQQTEWGIGIHPDVVQSSLVALLNAASNIMFIERPAAPYTDSGYASAPRPESEVDSLKQHDRKDSAQFEQQPTEQDVDDTATQYSDVSSKEFPKRHRYIQEMAEDLFSKIGTPNVDGKTQTEILEILPELLKAFALKIGHDGPTQMHRDVMVFIHRHRSEIAKAFADTSSRQDEDDPDKIKTGLDGMSMEDLHSWLKNQSSEWVPPEEEPGGPSLEDIDSQGAGPEEAEDEEVPESWLLAYQEFVPSTKAYEWLLTRLRREFHLAPTEPNTIRTIRDEIMSSLPSAHRISRKVSSKACSARFDLDFDILGFFESEKYSGPPEEVFEGVITVTGSCRDAQAATSAQYLRQTWPSSGEVMVQLIKGALHAGMDQRIERNISDGTTLTACLSEVSGLLVEAVGLAVSIAEIGEQLAWLGAALRTSPQQDGPVHCTPTIHTARIAPPSTDAAYRFEFTLEAVPQSPRNANGQCWNDIFRNPVIVKGYPIPQRVEWNTGLEVSLNIMAGLARTQRVDRFKEKVYIKGFSTLLVPTKRSEDILCWHLIYNRDGSRISYLDDYLHQEQYIGRLDLENLRHVLGWCSEARFYAGSAQANYSVDPSRLPKPHNGCFLANTSVSSGRIIMGGPAFGRGAKDTPVQVSRNGYIPRLEWISTKFFLLWDEHDKRGWLVNGTSALLHVLRASLEYDSKGKFQSALLCKNEDLQQSRTPFTADSAVDVLINRNNRNLKLYEEKDGYLLLESQIDRFYNVLEKLIDHQTDLARDHDRNPSDKPRKYLEGWDFENLSKKHDPLFPCVATLEVAGKGWVDFTRGVHAVTLIGRGFGDIIRPADAGLCEYWAELPKHKYYMAGCLSDLAEVVKQHSSYDDSHVRLTDNLIWHTPTTVSASCGCRGALGRKHCEPVQTLFPLELSSILLPRRVPIQPDGNQAVIFGHNSHFSWVWGDTGHPEEGELSAALPSSATETDSDSFKDSGIGTSLGRSTSDARSSSQAGSSTRPSVRSPKELRNPLTPDLPASASPRGYTRGDYTVGIICALPKELKVVRALFDDRHEILPTEQRDSNQYALGKMGCHMVVAACLPAGEYGTNSAAAVATNMARSFTSLRFCLLVGIAGGVPSEKNDIRLGDVVVSQPTGTCSGVLQYDLGKQKEGMEFEPTGSLQRPPRALGTAISSLKSDPNLAPNPLRSLLEDIEGRMPQYGHPGREQDTLFRATCAACRPQQEESTGGCPHMKQRSSRPTTDPMIHYGPIASGNRVVKDAAFRDKLALEKGVLCFEMEAAGVINIVDCLVIRGICDYCDTQKNDVWQEYAAATAAAYAKLLLRVVARLDDVSGTDCEEPPRKKRNFGASYV